MFISVFKCPRYADLGTMNSIRSALDGFTLSPEPSAHR